MIHSAEFGWDSCRLVGPAVGRSTFFICNGISHNTQQPMLGTDSPCQVMGGHTEKDSLDLIRVRLDFLSDNDRE